MFFFQNLKKDAFPADMLSTSIFQTFFEKQLIQSRFAFPLRFFNDFVYYYTILYSVQAFCLTLFWVCFGFFGFIMSLITRFS